MVLGLLSSTIHGHSRALGVPLLRHHVLKVRQGASIPLKCLVVPSEDELDVTLADEARTGALVERDGPTDHSAEYGRCHQEKSDALHD